MNISVVEGDGEMLRYSKHDLQWETWEYDIDTWTNVLVCAALGEECSDEGRRTDCPLKLVEDKEVEP